MVKGNLEMNYSELNDDIWCEIISYLNLKSIYSLENSNKFFQSLFARTRFWKRKLKREFPDEIQIDEEDDYQKLRKLYWIMFLQTHRCNVCKLYFIENICPNIPECRKCNWLEMLD